MSVVSECFLTQKNYEIRLVPFSSSAAVTAAAAVTHRVSWFLLCVTRSLCSLSLQFLTWYSLTFSSILCVLTSATSVLRWAIPSEEWIHTDHLVSRLNLQFAI